MASKNIFLHPRTSFLQKALLLLFGVLATIFVLEAGLRTVGFILESTQEYRNLVSIRKHGEYRIMCIGESTTSGQYPYFLEEALTRSNIGIKFTIIDKGLVATNTSLILSQLEKNIERYRPDLVIAMIGINDGGSHLPEGFDSDPKSFFKSLKTYKLAKLLVLHIEDKAKAIKASRENNKAYTDFPKHEEPDSAPEGTGKAGIKNCYYFYDLGIRLFDQRDFVSGKEAFRKAISLNPYFVAPYLKIASSDDADTDLSLEKQILEKYKMLIKTGALNENYFDEKQIRDIFELCRFFIRKGMYLEVEEFCKEMLDNNFLRKYAYSLLAEVDFQQKKYATAEELFKKAIELNLVESRAFDYLAVIYHERGQHDLSEQYLRKAERLRPDYPKAITISNYKEIKNILDRRNIKLACMQYPMRSIGPLREIFREEKGIIFIDNEQVFKSAIANGSYYDFFLDMFALNFGHCTDKGNKLLADNIANVIAKEVFHK